LALYQGYQGTTAAPAQLSGLGFPAQPDLAIVALGVNDASNSVAKTTFRDALDRLVWSLRYGKSDACSIIIVAQYTADGTLTTATSVANSDYTAGVTTAYRDIKAAMIEVAQAHTCALVDVHGAFGRKPVTNGWITSVSDIHPTTAGIIKTANLLNAIV
jgi:lysophospholipase L1-like esterase